jgi:hypothetical protein
MVVVKELPFSSLVMSRLNCASALQNTFRLTPPCAAVVGGTDTGSSRTRVVGGAVVVEGTAIELHAAPAIARASRLVVKALPAGSGHRSKLSSHPGRGLSAA